MVKVQKLFGEMPETIMVLSEAVSFDEEGNSEVSADVAEVLAQIPGYVVEGHEQASVANEPSEIRSSQQIADVIISEAEAEAERIIADAHAQAEQIIAEAQASSEVYEDADPADIEANVAPGTEPGAETSEAQKTSSRPKRTAPQTK